MSISNQINTILYLTLTLNIIKIRDYILLNAKFIKFNINSTRQEKFNRFQQMDSQFFMWPCDKVATPKCMLGIITAKKS